MGYEWSFGFLLRYSTLFWIGIGYTLLYTVGTVLLGLLLGLVLGLARLSRSRLVNVPLVAFIEVFRCTPLLVHQSSSGLLFFFLTSLTPRGTSNLQKVG